MLSNIFRRILDLFNIDFLNNYKKAKNGHRHLHFMPIFAMIFRVT